MNRITRPLRQAVRALARTPLFTAVTLLTLAVGIGANTAVFSVVHSILIKPLPFPAADRLVGLWHVAPGLGVESINQSPALYFTYREESELLVDSGMWDNASNTVTGLAEPQEVASMYVTDGTLPLLGVKPTMGRLFTAEDDSPGTTETVLLTYAYWQQHFGADPEAVGRTLQVDGRPREIIGVLPADLDFLDQEPAIFLPMRIDRAETRFGNFSYQGIGRLRPGVTIEQLDAEMARMIPLALERFPLPEGLSAGMVEEMGFAPAARPLSEDVVGDVGKVLWLLLGTVGLVLLVACANVANLLLVRAEARQQEVAIRSALGAGKAQVARGFLAESLLLALGGAIAGVGLAWAGLKLLIWLGPQSLPRLDEISLSAPALLFTLGLALLAALLVSLLPIVRIGATNLAAALREGGRGSGASRTRNRARNALVAGQIALALVLLVGSGLMIRSLLALSEVHPGFEHPEEVLTVRLAIPSAMAEEPAAVARLHETLLHKLEQLPGITAAGASSSVTMDGWDSNDPIFVEDFPTADDQLPPLRRFKWITPGYFETMGNPVLAGRAITWADLHDRTRVAVVTENLALTYWDSAAEALGRRIRMSPASPWREIVGVVGDVRDDGVEKEATTVVYWPMVMEDFWEPGTFAPRSMAYALRSPRVGSPGFLDEVRQAVWSVSPSLPLARVQTLDEILQRSMARTSFTLVMVAIAAATALLLGGIGIYGVTSYVVSQRSREMGVRLALGAQPQEVARLVLRHGLALAVTGVALGLVAAVGLTRSMAALLHGVRPVDPATYGTVSLVVALIALAASYFPARRAAALDPIETLRWE
jgi:predicted permease